MKWDLLASLGGTMIYQLRHLIGYGKLGKYKNNKDKILSH